MHLLFDPVQLKRISKQQDEVFGVPAGKKKLYLIDSRKKAILELVDRVSEVVNTTMEQGFALAVDAERAKRQVQDQLNPNSSGPAVASLASESSSSKYSNSSIEQTPPPRPPIFNFGPMAATIIYSKLKTADKQELVAQMIVQMLSAVQWLGRSLQQAQQEVTELAQMIELLIKKIRETEMASSTAGPRSASESDLDSTFDSNVNLSQSQPEPEPHTYNPPGSPLTPAVANEIDHVGESTQNRNLSSMASIAIDYIDIDASPEFEEFKADLKVPESSPSASAQSESDAGKTIAARGGGPDLDWAMRLSLHVPQQLFIYVDRMMEYWTRLPKSERPSELSGLVAYQLFSLEQLLSTMRDMGLQQPEFEEAVADTSIFTPVLLYELATGTGTKSDSESDQTQFVLPSDLRQDNIGTILVLEGCLPRQRCCKLRCITDKQSRKEFARITSTAGYCVRMTTSTSSAHAPFSQSAPPPKASNSNSRHSYVVTHLHGLAKSNNVTEMTVKDARVLGSESSIGKLFGHDHVSVLKLKSDTQAVSVLQVQDAKISAFTGKEHPLQKPSSGRAFKLQHQDAWCHPDAYSNLKPNIRHDLREWLKGVPSLYLGIPPSKGASQLFPCKAEFSSAWAENEPIQFVLTFADEPRNKLMEILKPATGTVKFNDIALSGCPVFAFTDSEEELTCVGTVSSVMSIPHDPEFDPAEALPVGSMQCNVGLESASSPSDSSSSSSSESAHGSIVRYLHITAVATFDTFEKVGRAINTVTAAYSDDKNSDDKSDIKSNDDDDDELILRSESDVDKDSDDDVAAAAPIDYCPCGTDHYLTKVQQHSLSLKMHLQKRLVPTNDIKQPADGDQLQAAAAVLVPPKLKKPDEPVTRWKRPGLLTKSGELVQMAQQNGTRAAAASVMMIEDNQHSKEQIQGTVGIADVLFPGVGTVANMMAKAVAPTN